jgi:c-di-GMP-binding flagellar brake protein YcgR
MDRRRFSRIAFKVEVVVSWGATALAAQTADLSLGGIYLTTPLRIPLNERVDVRITSPEGCSPRALTARALVVRHDDRGMGLVFTNMDFESFFALTQFVTEGLGDRTRSAREVLDFLSHPPGEES